eukprot:9206-Eustigmatos_ZCMA.PRE.1
MEQQDATEFLLYLMANLTHELNRATPEERPWFKRAIEEDNKTPTVAYEGFDVGRVRALADDAWTLRKREER